MREHGQALPAHEGTQRGADHSYGQAALNARRGKSREIRPGTAYDAGTAFIVWSARIKGTDAIERRGALFFGAKE